MQGIYPLRLYGQTVIKAIYFTVLDSICELNHLWLEHLNTN